MIIYKQIADIQKRLVGASVQGMSTGFVPTMGALHSGHVSLIAEAKKDTDIVICSIFVNPTQFNDPEDFEKYPVTIDADIYLLEKAGCTILFLPTLEEIYPEGLKKNVHFEVGFIETILDGKYRPGHFQGVCQVVHRLLEIIKPCKLYLGQKDFQQYMVIKKMAANYFPLLKIIICPTEREISGLAMSSRNKRLTDTQKLQAPEIFITLLSIKKNMRPGLLNNLLQTALQNLQAKGFRVDYIAIANAHTLQLLDTWDGKEKTVALIAAFLDEVRLIDNMIVNE
jgi:pantoate--beta-alanine ligase